MESKALCFFCQYFQSLIALKVTRKWCDIDKVVITAFLKYSDFHLNFDALLNGRAPELFLKFLLLIKEEKTC